MQRRPSVGTRYHHSCTMHSRLLVLSDREWWQSNSRKISQQKTSTSRMYLPIETRYDDQLSMRKCSKNSSANSKKRNDQSSSWVQEPIASRLASILPGSSRSIIYHFLPLRWENELWMSLSLNTSVPQRSRLATISIRQSHNLISSSLSDTTQSKSRQRSCESMEPRLSISTSMRQPSTMSTLRTSKSSEILGMYFGGSLNERLLIIGISLRYTGFRRHTSDISENTSAMR